MAGEKRGEPVIMNAAHTEPQAGSDMEDEEMMPKARVGTTAKRTPEGYLITGQKIFISSGHFAKLLQIYEGTNQINPKHLWDSIIARQTTM